MSTPKAEDRAEQGDRLPKKKKRKVVLKETIKESEEESRAEAKEAMDAGPLGHLKQNALDAQGPGEDGERVCQDC